MQTNKSFKFWQWWTIIVSMIVYSIFYFVRKNFSIAMPGLTAEYGISNTSFGIIIAIGSLIYGLSRFINGFIVEKVSTKLFMAIGLLLCAAANFCFGFGVDLSYLITGVHEGPQFVNILVLVMGITIVLNQYFQGFGYPPCARMLPQWIAPGELSTKMSIWNTSHSIGSFLAVIICGMIMTGLGSDMSGNPEIVGRISANLAASIKGWDSLAVADQTAHPSAAILCITALKDTPQSVGLPEIKGTETGKEKTEKIPGAHKKFLAHMVFRNKWVWILATANIFVYVLRMGVLDWGPKFLQQGDNPLSPTLAGWTIGIFEVCGCIGMLLAGWLTDKLFKGKGQQMCLVEMVLCALCLIAIHFLPEGASPVIMLSLLALAGFFLYGPQALYCVVTGKHATKKAASAAAGLVGLFCYVSVLFTGLGIGFLSDTFGQDFWNNLFIIMAGVSVLSAAALIPIWNIKDDGYLHEA